MRHRTSLRHRTPLSSDRIVNIHYTFLEVPIKSRSSGRTFCAPSVGAFVKCMKSIFYHLAEKLNMGCYNFWSFVAINKDPSKYFKAHFMQPVLCSFNRD